MLEVFGPGAVVIQKEPPGVYDLVTVPDDPPAQARHGLDVWSPVRGEDVSEAPVAAKKDAAKDVEESLEPREAGNIHRHLLRPDPEHGSVDGHPKVQPVEEGPYDPVHETQDLSEQGEVVLVPPRWRQENHPVQVVVPAPEDAVEEVNEQPGPTKAVPHRSQLVVGVRGHLAPHHLRRLRCLHLVNLFHHRPHVVLPQLVEREAPKRLDPLSAPPWRGSPEVGEKDVESPVICRESDGALVALENPPVGRVHHPMLEHHNLLGLWPRDPVKVEQVPVLRLDLELLYRVPSLGDRIRDGKLARARLPLHTGLQHHQGGGSPNVSLGFLPRIPWGPPRPRRGLAPAPRAERVRQERRVEHQHPRQALEKGKVAVDGNLGVHRHVIQKPARADV
mmetsp:Transcript_4979/g.17907  ORF Transcript_4979/g.17907 Transcript_4979/m.17907 type:complete len:391 (+) Transcript_4979:1590-2762(+)